MRITLYLDDKILEFKLPNEISGSFSFDENEEEESKLINIEASNGVWYLYPTNDVSIIQEGPLNTKVELKENNFYSLKREEKNYLIYITSAHEKNIMPYIYNQNTNIILGNNENCNIKYNCPFFNNEIINIKYEEQKLILNVINNTKIYINNHALLNNKYYINIGDQIHIFGLRITFLNKIFLINNPNENIFINETPANINYLKLPKEQEYSNEEIKDIDLYQENSYFSKSPRLRRFIETKEIKLDPPPKSGLTEEMPLLMVIGPMLTMGITASVTILNTLLRLNANETTVKQSWPQLVTGSAMLLSTLFWPIITRLYTKKMKKRKERELIKKYNEYLETKEKELEEELKLQHDILIENLIPISECINMINNKGVLFWNKRNDENDFLNVRVGTGDARLDVVVKYPENGFTIDEDVLRKKADELVEKYKYIKNVPIGYSLYENKVTAIMGELHKSNDFVNNIILQLLTFYSYEDLKIVVFTNEEKKNNWNYIKYLNHNFTNDKSLRFFSTNSETIPEVSEYLNVEISNRINQLSNNKNQNHKPYYLIIIDDYEEVKKQEFIKNITETEENLGFSLLIIENRLSKLPSKCNNFISLTGTKAGILKNSYEKQEQISFNDEVIYNIDMMRISEVLSNIPVEFEEGIKSLPDVITFLEMEKVGRVEQLNILNRWNTNDSTMSLKTEIGVDELGNLMYLDLHEKYHGPHGLIAGMTGSGKSEFIITYILSMAINYSPEYVSFILIDYKGGGLAGAFENKTTKICLPHLAGVITNLDKAEMDRTLVSIDSEITRRQALFNEVRDKLGESTIDIYKYQKFYKENKVSEPIPHLFIICDEFAELKAQQPDFMDNLISVARIGRSLGIHLILATQKPSGVVNEQIWSNSKFRVCLKVQDESDSKEMLKRPDAASIKQTGRFYLQVGYDELFALGQSGWCGAKYYPSNKIIKQIDKSINFINDCGIFVKSIQASSNNKIQAQGEQLAAIMQNIMEVSQITNKKSKRLWLENISPVILVDDLIKKYNINTTPYNVKAIIGEYDAPEKQQQGILEYALLEQGNTLIYGLDSSEKEMLLDSVIYSTITRHTSEEINYYIIDYGSESLNKFTTFPQVGGIVLAGEDEKFKNLIKLIKNELTNRKKIFSEFGGEYKNYIKHSNKHIPVKVIILNNFDSIFENNQDMYEYLPDLIRDSERYGIIFILTANASNSVSSKISQNFDNIYAFKMKDPTEYNTIFNSRKKIEPRDIVGRGIVNNGELHEFQTSSIIEKENELNEYLITLSKKQNIIKTKANKIPTLPEIVSLDIVEEEIKNLNNIPIGISKTELEINTFDFMQNQGTIISANKLTSTNNFVKSLIYTFTKLKEIDLLFIDGPNKLQEIKNITNNYYNSNFESLLENIDSYFEKILQNNIKRNQILVIYGIERFLNKLNNNDKFQNFMTKLKQIEQVRVIIIDEVNKIKNYLYESWYTTTFSNTEGIWIGKGIVDQNIFKLSTIKKEYMQEIKNDFGYNIQEGSLELIKIINFYKKSDGENNEK